jgi:hypothetical protein
MDRYSWLARLVVEHLVWPSDRLHLGLASRTIYGHIEHALYEHIKVTTPLGYDAMAERLRRLRRGASVRVIELGQTACNAGLVTGAADDLLALCPSLDALHFTLSATRGTRSRMQPGAAPYELPVGPKSDLRAVAPRLTTLVVTLPSQSEACNLADACLPLLLLPLDYVLTSALPSTLVLLSGFLVLAPAHLPSSLRTIELDRAGLLSGTLAALIELLTSGQTLILSDARLHLVRPRWHALSPLDQQPASAWLRLADLFHCREAAPATKGATVCVRCGCGPAGRRAHLPGGWKGEAAPDVREAVARAFEARKVRFAVEGEADACD